MTKGIIGRKLGMTQIFTEDGTLLPVTVIEAGPCVVTRKKTEDKDGYKALQLGFGDIKEKKLNRPELGQFKKRGLSPKKYLQEIRDMEGEFNEGDEVTVSEFDEGDKVNVTGKSKGKGFSGNVKRWNHGTGPKTHGSHSYRAPGSIGSVDAARVFKGQKMPGRMGNEKVTIKNLEVVKVDEENNIMMVKGSVPGPKKGILTIKTVG